MTRSNISKAEKLMAYAAIRDQVIALRVGESRWLYDDLTCVKRTDNCDAEIVGSVLDYESLPCYCVNDARLTGRIPEVVAMVFRQWLAYVRAKGAR